MESSHTFGHIFTFVMLISFATITVSLALGFI